MRTCPRCGLLSPDTSIYCECGFDLESDVRSELDRERTGWRAGARRQIWAGVFVGAEGAALTLATYLSVLDRGGTFYIFHGMIAAGVVIGWRGYVRLRHVADLESADKKAIPGSG
jgi:hypothetical protein